MFKYEFAASLFMSLSSLQRLEKKIGYILPGGLLSLEVREGFLEKKHEYELKKRDECLKKTP